MLWAAAGCSGSSAEASTKAKRKLEVKQFQGITSGGTVRSKGRSELGGAGVGGMRMWYPQPTSGERVADRQQALQQGSSTSLGTKRTGLEFNRSLGFSPNTTLIRGGTFAFLRATFSSPCYLVACCYLGYSLRFLPCTATARRSNMLSGHTLRTLCRNTRARRSIQRHCHWEL
jgi:hypothetical protein